jgi:alcohol dehydrogenase
LYACGVARAMGASVHYVDRNPHRVQAAVTMGARADHHVGPWPKRFEPTPVTVDVTGTSDGLACVIRSTERYGHCTSLARFTLRAQMLDDFFQTCLN